jgi:hypothetical protein
MPQNYFIHGLDEAGRIGDKIIFCDASIEVENETSLMLRNLWHFRKLILNKYDVSGYDEKTLLRFVSEFVDDGSTRINLFSLNHEYQNRLLSGLFYQMSNSFFKLRGDIIEALQKRDRTVFSITLDILNRFKRKGIYANSFVKSYIMREMINHISGYYKNVYSLDVLKNGKGPRIDIQIDGGFPYGFWWKDFLDYPESGLIKEKCLVTGITNGDDYYPVISLAGTIASILNKYPGKQYNFSINDFKSSSLDITSEDFSRFYFRHAYSLSKPIYENRILLLGRFSDELKSILPYSIYLDQGRTRSFEPFEIHTSIQNFMKDFGYGLPENTLIIIGKIENSEQKKDIRYCKDRGFSTIELNQCKEAFEKFFSNLNSESELIPSQRKSEIQSRLTKIQSFCSSELQ